LICPVLAGAALCMSLSTHAAAQSVRDEARPARYIAAWSVGVPLRLGKTADLGQSTFAPAFMDALGGYVFASKARLRHGMGLGLSTNLSSDGGYTEPVAALDQLVVMPSYLLYWDANPDLFGVGHFGVPIVVRGGPNAGAEVAFALGYRWLAGLGTFAEAGLDAFAGASKRLNVSFSLEAGLFFDYEVLP
jgi:hypothetical protein